MPESAAEKRAREDEAKRREEEDRALYEEFGLDYDNEDHRTSVAVRRLARKIDEREAERSKPHKGPIKLW
jgi:hypothetical protein